MSDKKLNKVSRTLFKSFLKWNRRTNVRLADFKLSLDEYGLKNLLPINSEIHGSKGVQKSLYYCFKNISYSHDNVDFAFNVLKKLNKFNSIIDKRVQEHMEKLEKPEHFPFKIGQIVMHKKFRYRVIVTSLLHSDGKEVFVGTQDSDDIQSYYPTNIELNYFKVFPCEDFELVKDPKLCKLGGEAVSLAFLYYNHSINRYIPRSDIFYLYPHDFSDVEYLENGLSREQNHEYINAMISVATSLNHIISDIQSILLKNFDKDINTLSKQGSSETLFNSVLDELAPLISNLIYYVPDGDIQDASFQKEIVAKKLDLSEGDLKYKETCDILYRDFQSPMNREKGPFFVYHQLSVLLALFQAVDQILQLRFQRFGIGAFELLKVTKNSQNERKLTAKDDFLSKSFIEKIHEMDRETLSTPILYQVGEVVLTKKFGSRKAIIIGYETRPTQDFFDPMGKANLNQPFYNVLLEDLEALPKGSKNVFLLPQDSIVRLENDDQKGQIDCENTSKYFSHYDPQSKKYVPRLKLKYCFSEPSIIIDEPNSSPYRDIFIQSGHEYKTRMVLEESNGHIEDENKLDLFLIELYDYLKSTLISSNQGFLTNPANASQKSKQIDKPLRNRFSVDDLMSLMRLASRKQDSQFCDDLISKIFMSHSSPSMNRLIRLMMVYEKASNFKKCCSVGNAALSFDKDYFYACNVLARVSIKKSRWNKCIALCEQALTINPKNYWALSFLSYSQSMIDQEEISLENMMAALDLYPWGPQFAQLVSFNLAKSKNTEDMEIFSTKDLSS